MNETLLSVHAVHAGYAGKEVLRGVTVEVAAGEILAICGANGAGKSTLLKAIVGLIPLDRGEITFQGRDVAGWSVRRRLAAGVSYVPQGNRVFDELTVGDNVAVCPRLGNRSVDTVLERLPALRARRQQVAGRLSGGERQLLALNMGLLGEPQLLLLDEPSLGLAPAVAEAVVARLRTLRSETGITMVVVEHRLRLLKRFADRVLVLRLGQVSFEGSPGVLLDAEVARAVFF